MKTFYCRHVFVFACLVIFFITFVWILGIFGCGKASYDSIGITFKKKSVEQILFLEVTFETSTRIQGLDAVIKDGPKNAL